MIKAKQAFPVKIFILYSFLIITFALNTTKADQYKSYVIIEPKNSKNKPLLTPEMLEKNLAKINQTQRARAERFLARHFVEKKQYNKAIEFYQQALISKDLSIYAEQQMLEELSYVLMLTKQYQKVIETLNKLQQANSELEAQRITGHSSDNQQTEVINDQRYQSSSVNNILMRSQAYYYLHKYNEATLILSQKFNDENLHTKPIAENNMLSLEHIEQAMLLYYNMKAFDKTILCLNYLIQQSPETKFYWQTLTHVYTLMDKPKEALNTLVLAENHATKIPVNTETINKTEITHNVSGMNNKLPTSFYDWLINLYIENKLYFQAASKLAQLLEDEKYPSSGKNYYQLFNLWFHAKEVDRAQRALQKSAELEQSGEYFIQLAQFHLQQNNWLKTEQAVLNACKIGISDNLISTANLLLGVQFAHRGEKKLAKEAFYNASIMGGAVSESAQWLRYLNNGKPDKNIDPYQRFTGNCVPKSEQSIIDMLASYISVKTQQNIPEQIKKVSEEKVVINAEFKKISSMSFYGMALSVNPIDLKKKILSSALRINKALLRQGKQSDGPLHMLLEENTDNNQSNKELKFILALPVQGHVPAKSNIRQIKVKQIKVLSYVYKGDLKLITQAWNNLKAYANQEGYQETKKSRLLFLEKTENGELTVELQLGVTDVLQN